MSIRIRRSSAGKALRSMQATAHLLTPRGAGAVAVIEVRAVNEAQSHALLSAFSAEPPRDLSQTPINRILFGRWRGEDVVVVKTEPAVWEIHCHGGAVAIDRILKDLERAGARDVKTALDLVYASTLSEFEVAEYLNTTISQCRTRKTASLTLAQSDGRLVKLFADLKNEDSSVGAMARRIVARWRHVAEHLVQPWKVALVGLPNAGKSSLINTISGRNRAIVSDVPGTTRDLLEADVFLEGWPFLFVDSAGIRDAAGSDLERSGIEKSRILATVADVVCVVVDQSQPSEGLSLLNRDLGRSTCILLNKCDLEPTPRVSSLLSREVPVFRVSSVTGEGITEFLAWLVRTVIPEEPSHETTLPILPRSYLDHVLSIH